MKNLLAFILMALSPLAAQAADGEQDSLSFTIIKENPITSVKNQNRSGTCWDFATVGFFEGEILRKTGRTYDLCEMFVAPTQELRQQRFDTWDATYDHVMLIYGKAKDQQGNDYYLVKNSWGEAGSHKGIWYMRKNYIALNTTYIFLNRHALNIQLP